MNSEDLKRFMSYVYVDPITGCWFWGGTLIGHGLYGGFYYEGRTAARAAHIVSYEHFVGPVPEGMELGHTCKNKCANWKHVRPITHLQNVQEGNRTLKKNRRQILGDPARAQKQILEEK